MHSQCRTCGQTSFAPSVEIDSANLRGKIRSEYGSSCMALGEIRELVEAAQKDVEDYKAEVDRLKYRIRALNAQRGRVEEHIKQLMHLSSPVRKIPNEILCRIFDFSCGTNVIRSSYSRDCLRYLPAMTLSSICSRWRNLALILPSLWSRLSVELFWPDEESSQHLSLLHLYLSRSKGHPLTLDITLTSEQSDQFPALLLLGTHSQRWKSVKIDVVNVTDDGDEWQEWGWQDFFISPERISFPLLEELEIGEANLTGNIMSDVFQPERAPKLHSLSWDGAEDTPLFPWNKLRALDTFIYFGSLDRFLNASPGLQSITFKQVEHGNPFRCVPPRSADTVTSLALTLAESGSEEDLAEEVFASYTFPSLATLQLESSKDSPYIKSNWAHGELIAFVLRSSCLPSLTTFTLRRLPLSDSNLVSLLKLLPSLAEVEIDDTSVPVDASPITIRLIRSLNGNRTSELRPSTTPLLPNLRKLSLNCGGGFLRDDDELIDMIESRWLWPGFANANLKTELVCLREVVIRVRDRKIPPAVFDAMCVLDKAGMRTSVERSL